MIDLYQALEIARKYYYEKGQQELTKAYEADDAWIVYGGKKNQTKFGNAAIAINKQSGETSRFVLPSRSNFEILRKAKLIELE